jgi:hypothetical protein
MATRVRIGVTAFLLAVVAAGSLAHGASSGREQRIAKALVERGYSELDVRCPRSAARPCRVSGTREKADGTRLRCRARAALRPRSVRLSKRRCAPRAATGPLPALGFNGAVDATDVGLSRRAGATSGRIGIHWSQAEPVRGQYDFSQVEPMYRRLVDAGMPPVAFVIGAPAWAQAPGHPTCQVMSGCAYPPSRAHDADWQRFIVELIERFPKLRGIEVWNEPNWDAYWSTGADPERYAELVSLADKAASWTAADPPIVFAGLYPGGGRTSWIDPATFLRRALAAGARYDALGIHSYPAGYGSGFVANAKSEVAELWKITASFNRPRETWVTEFGVSTAGTSFMIASEQQQADALTDVYEWARGTGRIPVFIVHMLRDSLGLDGGEWGIHLGLRRLDGSPKPAFCALAALRSLPCS